MAELQAFKQEAADAEVKSRADRKVRSIGRPCSPANPTPPPPQPTPHPPSPIVVDCQCSLPPSFLDFVLAHAAQSGVAPQSTIFIKSINNYKAFQLIVGQVLVFLVTKIAFASVLWFT